MSHESRSKMKRKKSGPRDEPASGPRDRIRNRDWSAKTYREGSASGPASIEYSFPTQDGGTGKLRIPLSELRHPKRLLDQFFDLMPVFPRAVGDSDELRVQFLKELQARMRGPVEIMPTRTGFIDLSSFARWNDVIRADGKPRPLAKVTSGEPVIDNQGTWSGSNRDVLRLARRSTYLAFAIGVALAAPLRTYLKLYRDAEEQHSLTLTEGAIFNFSGESSSGKSSVCLAALSLVGSIDRAIGMNFSERGVSEHAADSNDLVFVVDDTERSNGKLVRVLRLLTHLVSGGRSKRISQALDPKKFPDLRWSTLVLCSSPEPIPVLAAKQGWSMSRGDKGAVAQYRGTAAE